MEKKKWLYLELLLNIYRSRLTDCWKHDENSRPDSSQVVKNLFEIIISDANFKNETPQLLPHNVTDEVISIGLKKLNIAWKRYHAIIE
ncbi:hypothetical protein Glove_372g97 [Diversispora epigaea]|uniref:Uncharacterized protein n=1 Tax=Diversispora epigaea TaxID=1348612 RepID=A0A397H7E1_9GLOM|nr:hypothetical protein Glove_372g97 [Diversispora epigaea]